MQAVGTGLLYYGCGGETTPSTVTTPTVPLPDLIQLDTGAVFAFDAEGNRYEARGTTLTKTNPAGTQLWSVPGLVRPQAVAVGPDGRVWALERSPGQLRLFRADGSALGTAGSFRVPQGLAVGPDRVYVSEAIGASISILDSSGALLGQIKHAELDYPRGLALNRSGELLVVSSTRGNVLIFGSDGSLRGRFGSLVGPRGLAIRASDGLIAVSDVATARIEYFSSSLGSLGNAISPKPRDLRYTPEGNLIVSGPDPQGTTGGLFPFASVFRLIDWERPQGQSLPVAGNTALFGVLGQQFGGTGSSFNLPDLTPLPVQNGSALNWILCRDGDDPTQAMLGMLGEVRLWPGGNRPPNWLPCDGTEIDVARYPELVALIGGRLPHLNDYVPGVSFILCAEGIRPGPSFPPELLYLGTLTMYQGPLDFQSFAVVSDQPVLLPVTQFGPLYSIVANNYGGDASNFGLPNPRPVDPGTPWLMPTLATPPPFV